MIGFGIYIGVLLLVSSIFDGRYCSLPVWLLMIGGVGGLAGVFYALLSGKRSLAEVVLAFLPGIGAIMLGYITREQIGYGDGLLLLIIGGCLEIEQIMLILMVALAGTCLVSVFLMVCKKASRTSRIPFVPFLTIGYVWVMFGGVLAG